MNETESAFGPADDANVDTLLREFFDREMPAELRGRSDLPPRARPKIARAPGREKSEWPALTVLAGYLLLSAAALSLPLFPSSDGSQHSAGLPVKPVDGEGGPASAQTAASAAASNRLITPDSATAELEVSVSKDIEAIERYDTVNGPVEQRSKLRIKNVSIYDPETGSKVELTLPELDIEIFPIDDEEADESTIKSGGDTDAAANAVKDD